MTRKFHFFTAILLTFFGAAYLNAQSSLDVHIGVSGANAKSTGLLVDTFGDGTLYSSPSLDGAFMNLGAGFMLSPHFGVGGEFSFKPGKSDFAGLNYRPLFYDFNGILHPAPSSKRVRSGNSSGYWRREHAVLLSAEQLQRVRRVLFQ